MHDVLVLCEGQTEREFCRSVVREYVATRGIALAGTLVGKPQRKRGGISSWGVYRGELLRLAKERADRYVGVLVDYYAMPDSWPGRSEARTMTAGQRGIHVETCLCDDLNSELGPRFLPCVQLHEFEALLFVDPSISALSIALGGVSTPGNSAEQLAHIKAEFNDKVELIDDSPDTAPSKRLRNVFPGYDKVAWGVAAAKKIGIDALRQGCPWLDRWIKSILLLGEN